MAETPIDLSSMGVPKPLGLHAFELTTPCHRLILALEDIPEEIRGHGLQVKCVLREDIRLLGDAALITIRVQLSRGNSSL